MDRVQKEISPEYSLEGLILTLKLQYFGHLMRLGGTRRVGGLLGVAGKLSGTVSPFRAVLFVTHVPPTTS